MRHKNQHPIVSTRNSRLCVAGYGSLLVVVVVVAKSTLTVNDSVTLSSRVRMAAELL